MLFKKLHEWDLTPKEAMRLQEKMRGLVLPEDDFGRIRIVAGVDASYCRSEKITTAGVAVLTFPELELVETVTATEPTTFPYVPGLLSFREMPALLAALELVAAEPDLVIVDGQGLAHPRGFGIACHVGVVLDKPTIGCAKSRLIGDYAQPGPERGDSSPLVIGSQRVGSVLRTKSHVRPLFVSPGHRIGFESADRMILECTRGYRLPEPSRLAHEVVSRAAGILVRKA
jgi:deoxyribonuclease V